MTRSLLKQKAKEQLSKGLCALVLSGLLLGVIIFMPLSVQLCGFIAAIPNLPIPTNANELTNWLTQILKSPIFQTFTFIANWLDLVILLFSPVLILGVHHVYLKATTDEKPHFSAMFSKMSQFGTALTTYLLIGIFVSLWSLLLIIPGIIAAYSYSMVYFILAEHPEMSALEAIKESKRIMRGHKFDLFVLQLSFFWWSLLIVATFGFAAVYVIPYAQMAKANFYNEIKNV